jgi:hypothetical protein
MLTNALELSASQQGELLGVLKTRFEMNSHRHKGIEWDSVYERLNRASGKLRSLWNMEQTGGEPDVIGFDESTGEYLFCDCSAESPLGRRSICYDHKGQVSRKANQPKANAVDLANEMGVELLTESQYKDLQKLEEFDLKTSSWIKTPERIRNLGGALFCDRRYNQVFVYHNGAQSYYSARGFRAMLRV